LAIVDKAEHERLGRSCPALAKYLPGTALGGRSLRHMITRGYDYPVRYRQSVFSETRSALDALFAQELAVFNRAVGGQFGLHRPRILVVERGAAHPFYLSDAAEAKGAGAARRSIGNHAELSAYLAEQFGHVCNVALEGLPLPHQIALFSAADVIIAQHGAAL